MPSVSHCEKKTKCILINVSLKNVYNRRVYDVTRDIFHLSHSFFHHRNPNSVHDVCMH
jgi:hypothetical protein